MNYYIIFGNRSFEFNEDKLYNKNIIEEIRRNDIKKGIEIKEISCWFAFKEVKEVFLRKGFYIRSFDTKKVLSLMDASFSYEEAFNKICGNYTDSHKEIITKELNHFI